MPIFIYKAYDSQGQIVNAEIETTSLERAKLDLKAQGFSVASINEKRSDGVALDLFIKDRVSLDDLEFLTSELAILLESGVKIDKGLSIVSKGNKSDAVSSLLSEIHGNLKSGQSLSEAFKTKNEVFDPLYLNLLDIGEKSGRLPTVLEGLAKDLKFRKALIARVRQALTYPAIILFVCLACILFVFNYIVPQMGSIFSETDDIPVYTRALISASEWMINYQVWLFVFLFSVGLLVYSKRSDPNIVAFYEKYSMRLPLLSSVILQVERIRFNAAMALMLGAGIKVDLGIELAANSVKHPVLRRSLKTANENIKKGNSIASSLGATPIYPAFYVSLLEVGEESGMLAKIFAEISERTKTEFENWTDKVTSILEPLLILVMGGIVGGIVITMLLSVVSVNDIAI